jgi:hypothetical protein
MELPIDQLLLIGDAIWGITVIVADILMVGWGA